jgi:hypothetical protein
LPQSPAGPGVDQTPPGPQDGDRGCPHFRFPSASAIRDTPFSMFACEVA